jgi:hypothetical protein
MLNSEDYLIYNDDICYLLYWTADPVARLTVGQLVEVEVGGTRGLGGQASMILLTKSDWTPACSGEPPSCL